MINAHHLKKLLMNIITIGQMYNYWVI